MLKKQLVYFVLIYLELQWTLNEVYIDDTNLQTANDTNREVIDWTNQICCII